MTQRGLTAVPEEVDPMAAMQDLRVQVQAEMDAESLPQATVAREAGVSPAQVNGFLHGNYAGDIKAAAERIYKWLKMRQDRKAQARTLPSAQGWVQTPTAKRVMACLLFAHHGGVLGLVYGGAGLGKTETARHYASEARNVWIVTMSPSCKKIGALLNRLCKGLGIRPETVWPAQVEEQLIERLTGTRGLLIVDEASHLELEALDTLRSIQDASGVGMVLMGNETVYSKITGGARKAHLAQLYSRVRKSTRLTGAAEGDVETFAGAWNVSGKEEITYLRSIVTKHGALRCVDSTLRLAATYAGEGTPITLAHLKAAWRELGR